MRSDWSYHIQRLPLSHGASIPVFSTRDLPFEAPSTTARGRCLMAPCPWVQLNVGMVDQQPSSTQPSGDVASPTIKCIGGLPCWNGGAVWEQSWDQRTCRFSAHEASWIVNEFMHTYISYNSKRNYVWVWRQSPNLVPTLTWVKYLLWYIEHGFLKFALWFPQAKCVSSDQIGLKLIRPTLCQWCQMIHNLCGSTLSFQSLQLAFCWPDFVLHSDPNLAQATLAEIVRFCECWPKKKR